jgi:hypothetical protein
MLIFLLLGTPVLLAEAGDTTLLSLWASRDYQVEPFPDVWRPETIPPTVREVALFKGFDLKQAGSTITSFVARYGIPDRYSVTQKSDGQNFLIYDLPSGHSVGLYVRKPPYKTFSAVVIIDSGGNLVLLIK